MPKKKWRNMSFVMDDSLDVDLLYPLSRYRGIEETEWTTKSVWTAFDWNILLRILLFPFYLVRTSWSFEKPNPTARIKSLSTICSILSERFLSREQQKLRNIKETSMERDFKFSFSFSFLGGPESDSIAKWLRLIAKYFYCNLENQTKTSWHNFMK